MSSELPAGPCLNCGAEVTRAFCPECGQENRPAILPFDLLVKDVVDEFLKFDSRVFATLWLLVSRPGHLTREYLQGRRARYLSPFKLYFGISAAWFIAFAVSGHQQRLIRELMPPSVPAAQAQADLKFLEWLIANQGTLSFLLVPILALLLKLSHGRGGPLYAAHLVLAAHVTSFGFLVSFLTLLPIPTLLGDVLALGGPVIYGFLALRHLYPEKPMRTVLRVAIVAVGYFGLLVALAIVGWMVPELMGAMKTGVKPP